MALRQDRFIYDLEVYPNFFSAIFENVETKKQHIFVIFADLQGDRNSINQLNNLLEFIDKYIQWVIGYNNKEFDDLHLRYIISHSQRLQIAHPRKITGELYELTSSIIGHQRRDKRPPEAYTLDQVEVKFRSLDLILIFNPGERVSLKQLAISLRWPMIQDLPYPPGTIIIFDYITVVLKYQQNDVGMTRCVMENKIEDIDNRINYTVQYGTDVINSSNSQIGRRLLADLYSAKTGLPYNAFKNLETNYTSLRLADCVSPRIVFQTKQFKKLLLKVQNAVIDPNKKEEKIYGKRKRPQFLEVVKSKYLTHNMMLGGVHSNNPSEILEENELYAYIDIDVEGFYPVLWCIERFCPAHLQPVFLDLLLNDIIIPRKKIKKKLPVLAYMLKIGANAAFGLTDVKGDAKSWLKDPKVAKSITISGQLFLFMLMEALETHSNCIVVYSNTDGLTVRVPRTEIARFEMLCTRWETYTGFTLEKVYYRKMIIRDVSNYLMFTHSADPASRIKAKGAYLAKRPIHEGFNYPIIPIAVREYFDKGTPVEDTILNWKGVKEGFPIYDFLKSEKTDIHKFNVTIFPYNNVSDPYVLQKNNRWAVTRGNPEEGRIMKVHKSTGEKTEMQKGNLVTILNNIDETKSIEAYKLDYNFYITKAKTLIDLTKPLDKETHIDPVEQGCLFE